ncbi:hypothetical protein KR200_002018, partial [Drosophila serrata]
FCFFNCLQIGSIIFLVAVLEAQESHASESVITTEVTIKTEATDATKTSDWDSSSSTISTPTQSSSNDQSASDSSSVENAGYPFVRPGDHKPGLRHVKAHDGFHSLRKEKRWAHWNDAFTKPKL